MRPITISFTPLAAAAAFWLTGATGAGPFTPSVTATTDTLGHFVTITSAANLSAITFTLTGTDPDDKPQTEAIVGPNASTVTGVKYWKTLTSISASATLGANTADFGIAANAVSKTIPVNYIQASFNVTHMVAVTGTINYDVEYTEQDIWTLVPSTLIWFNHATIVNKTANFDGVTTSPIMASRLAINSVTGGATISYTLLQGHR
jgi:hypothetical protein